MTEEQKASIQYAAEWLFRSEDISNRKHAERLRALLAAGASEGQEPVAWQYENQHGNQFLTHKDPETWHPHDRARFKNFRALVFAATPAPSVADAEKQHG